MSGQDIIFIKVRTVHYQHDWTISYLVSQFGSEWGAKDLSCNDTFLWGGGSLSIPPPLLPELLWLAELGWSLSGEDIRHLMGDPCSPLFGRSGGIRILLWGDEVVAGLLWVVIGDGMCTGFLQVDNGIEWWRILLVLRCEGIVCWGWLQLPTWWPWCRVRGEGLLAGGFAVVDGEGVRARGDSGKLWTDFRRCGDLRLAVFLCLATCNELGRPRWAVADVACVAGEFGVLELGELDVDEPAWEESGDQGTEIGGERPNLPWEGIASPDEHDLFKGVNCCLPTEICGLCGNKGSVFLALKRRSRFLPFFFSCTFSRCWRFLRLRRAIFPGLPLRLEPSLIDVLSSGTARMLTIVPELSKCTTCVWSKLCTLSSFMWVMRSPSRRPASKLGLLGSTSCQIHTRTTYEVIIFHT